MKISQLVPNTAELDPNAVLASTSGSAHINSVAAYVTLLTPSMPQHLSSTLQPPTLYCPTCLLWWGFQAPESTMSHSILHIFWFKKCSTVGLPNMWACNMGNTYNVRYSLKKKMFFKYGRWSSNMWIHCLKWGKYGFPFHNVRATGEYVN